MRLEGQLANLFAAHSPEIFTMRCSLRNLACGALLGVAVVAAGSMVAVRPAQAFPKPSVFPVSWQLKFEHSMPKRIVVKSPNDPNPQAYWYVTFTVKNLTEEEQRFLPVFELVTNDGKVVRSDKSIPTNVFDEIKKREHNKLLESLERVTGRILIGEDQARDSVAIWPEPSTRMGTFQVFVGGLSGETITLKNGEEFKVTDWTKVTEEDKKGLTFLRKTLQLTYQIPGDEIRPEEDQVIAKGEEWVMR
jgi:hypothetical protein